MEKTQFSMTMVNKRGELAKLAELLARAEVNMEAISISDGVHTGTVKFVVSDPAAARQAFKQAGLHVYEQPVLVMPLSNRAGALAEICAKLAEDGHSINYIYGSSCSCEGSCDCKAQLMISVGDLEAADALAGLAWWPTG